jgi:hypothetical protein
MRNRKWNIDQFQKRLMKDEKIDEEEVWSAIRYLDPDEREKDKEANTATIIAILALLLIVGAVWVFTWVSSKTTVMRFTRDGAEKEAACPKLGLSRVVRAGSVALSQRLPSRLARR